MHIYFVCLCKKIKFLFYYIQEALGFLSFLRTKMKRSIDRSIEAKLIAKINKI